MKLLQRELLQRAIPMKDLHETFKLHIDDSQCRLKLEKKD